MKRITLAAALALLLAGCSPQAVPASAPNIQATIETSVRATLGAATPVAARASAAPTGTSPATAPTATAEPSPPAPPIPTVTPVPVPFVVVNTDGQGVSLRKEPGGQRLKAWPEKTVMQVIGEAQEVEGRKWCNVQDPDGTVGWVPWEYLGTPPRPSPTPDRSRYKLELLAGRGTIGEYGYSYVEGQVKNISGTSIKNVMALAEWYTPSGAFITSSDALIDFNPLLPGQTSPFKTMTRTNPEMKKFSIAFKEMFGTEIRYLDSRPK